MHEVKKVTTASMCNTSDGLDFVAANGEDILDVIFFNDEPWFNLSGYFNSKTSLMWSAFNSHEIMETPVRDITKSVAPTFLEEIINSGRYIMN